MSDLAADNLRSLGSITGRLTIVLTLPPSVNSMYRTWGGRIIKSEAYRLWIEEARFDINRQHVRARIPEPRYEVHLWMMLPDRKRRDLSNMVKAIEDVVSDYLGYDDKLHDVIHLYKALDRVNPRAVFVLTHKERRIPPPGVIEEAASL